MAPKGVKNGQTISSIPTRRIHPRSLLRFLRTRHQVKKLPIVSHESPKYPPDRTCSSEQRKAWLRRPQHRAALPASTNRADARWKGTPSRPRTCSDMGFATEMASLHVPADMSRGSSISDMSEVTQDYARPTKQQVVEAAELLFVDRIDVAAEAVRHRMKIGKLLRDAEGQIGALSEVLGGTAWSATCARRNSPRRVRRECAGSEPSRSNRYEAALGRTADPMDDQGRAVRGATADDAAGPRLRCESSTRWT